MKLSKERREKTVDYICDGIKDVIVKFDKRDPGSEGERKAQEHFAEELRQYSDQVTIEDFKLNPKSFMGWIPITLTLALISFVISFFIPFLAFVLLIIAAIPMLSQFVLYKQLIDPLFPEKVSCNVMAVKKPKGEVKRRIVFNGHADATWEWTYNHKFGFLGFTLMFFASILGLVYFLAYLIVTMIMIGPGMISIGGVPLTMGLSGLFFVPFWIGMYWFSNSKEVVDGANDNLTACLMSMAILKTMKEENIEFENTEVCALLTGSEEAGLRGAKAFAKAHKDDYKDCETIFVPMETLREIDHISIYTKDLNGLVKTDKDVASLIKKAGKNIGIDIPYATVSVGSTDAAALTQGGFKAACLAALDHKLRDYYHTRRDTYDNLDRDCLGVVYDIAMETLDLYDKEGLANNQEK
ncbi:MAG: M20/M25/M40 family metallo-hydrolase [Bacillota bacterium]